MNHRFREIVVSSAVAMAAGLSCSPTTTAVQTPVSHPPDAPDVDVARSARTGEPARRHILSLAAHRRQACAVRADHSVWCWGFWPDWMPATPYTHQRGRAPMPPSPMSGIPPAERVFMGDAGLCVSARGGGLRCAGETWLTGPPDAGQAVPMVWRQTPDVMAISRNHACALVRGTAWCWGDGNRDPWWLGRANREPAAAQTHPTPVSKPRRVFGLPELVELLVDDRGTCGLDRSNALWCWGSYPELRRRSERATRPGLDYTWPQQSRARADARSAGTGPTKLRTFAPGVKLAMNRHGSITLTYPDGRVEQTRRKQLAPRKPATRPAPTPRKPATATRPASPLGRRVKSKITQITEPQEIAYRLSDGQVHAVALRKDRAHTPQRLTMLDGVIALAGGGPSGMTCALNREEQIFCWHTSHPPADQTWFPPDVEPAQARIYLGWLRLPSSSTDRARNPDTATIPPSPAAPDAIVDIELSYPRACALQGDGRMSCWALGQENAPIWQQVPPLRAFTLGQVACGILDDGKGTVSCQRAHGSNEWATRDITGARDIVTTSNHTCVLHDDGAITCFATSQHTTAMQLGLDHHAIAVDKVTVPGVTDATSVAAYYFGGCATRQGGGLLCWHKVHGHIDIPSQHQLRSTSFHRSSGTVHALASDGRAWQVDLNARRLVPWRERVRWRQLVHPGKRVCGITDRGKLDCLDSDATGQPVAADGPAAGRKPSGAERQLTGIVHARVRGKTGCASDGKDVWCWGDSDRRALKQLQPVPVDLSRPVRDFALAGRNGAAVTRDGALWVWGAVRPTAPFLLDATQPIPVRRKAPRLRAIRVGGGKACAIPMRGRHVLCWRGANPRPARIALPSPARQIVISRDRVFTLLQNGRVAQWGNDDRHGKSGFTSATLMAGLGNIRALWPGYGVYCASTRSGRLYCWLPLVGPRRPEKIHIFEVTGMRLPRNAAVSTSGAGVFVDLAGQVVRLDMRSAVYAIRDQCQRQQSICRAPKKLAMCQRDAEQLALPDCASKDPLAVVVSPLTLRGLPRGRCRKTGPSTVDCGNGDVSFSADIQKFDLGLDHQCGLAKGKLYCFGDYGDGQLGDGRTHWRDRPVLVRLAP